MKAQYRARHPECLAEQDADFQLQVPTGCGRRISTQGLFNVTWYNIFLSLQLAPIYTSFILQTDFYEWLRKALQSTKHRQRRAVAI